MVTDTYDLPLHRIVIVPDLQPRVKGLDEGHVQALQDAPESWPPLVAVQQGGQCVLVDGLHRYAAAQNLSLSTVPVRIVPPPADGDLHALAFALNAAHGRPLGLADRRAFAERLLRQHPDWADREIGRRCGLSSNTVGAIRERLARAAQIEQTDTRVGAGGYVYSIGTNPKQRPPGELPEVGISAMVSDAVGRVFSPTERRQQRRVAQYLQRLAIALDDQDGLEGWGAAGEAAEACRLVLGAERAAELGERLGWTSRSVLDVALALGYDDEEPAE